MSDIFSVLGSAYASAPLATPNVKYTPVDAKSYEGSWTGTYSNGQKFEFQISEVSGFRARQISERNHHAVSASPDREFVVPHRQYQIHAERDRHGGGRQRRHRSGDRQFQPGPGQRNPADLISG